MRGHANPNPKQCADLFVVVSRTAHGDWPGVILRVVAGGQSDVDIVHLGRGVWATIAVTATVTLMLRWFGLRCVQRF